MYAVAVVLLVGAEGVGDVEVVYGVDGEEYEGLTDAVGRGHLAHDVFASLPKGCVVDAERVAIADDWIDAVVVDAGGGDGDADDGVFGTGGLGDLGCQMHVVVAWFEDVGGVARVADVAVAKVPDV